MSPSSLRILSGTGILGYGFDPVSVAVPDLDLVACDGGSTDGGPYYLGTGSLMVSGDAVRRDLEALWAVARHNDCPLVIGSCGGSGTDSQLDMVLTFVTEIAERQGWPARVAVIRSEISTDTVVAALREDRISSLDGAPTLDEHTITSATRIVAMMGTEPIAAALRADADVVLAGRASDAAIFAALPILRGLDPGLAWHAGKLLECGAACAEPPGQDCLVADLDDDGFTLYAPNPARRCTPQGVLAFALHETPDPFHHPECGGSLDLSLATAAEAGNGKVHVGGARFVPQPPSVRLEGVTYQGHRTVLFGATRDPRLIATLNSYLDFALRQSSTKMSAAGIDPDRYQVHVSVYGCNGVLGDLERSSRVGHEASVLAEVVADTRETSKAVAASLRSPLLHSHFAGRQCTEGNFALPFSPPELDGGDAYRFSIWHRMELPDPEALFPISYREVP